MTKITFKIKAYSDPITSIRDKILEASGLSASLDSGLLKNLWDKVPDSIKKKIDHGTPLSPTEQEEFDIAKREAAIEVRPSLKGLDQINNYYHETNPVGGRNVVFRSKDRDTYGEDEL